MFPSHLLLPSGLLLMTSTDPSGKLKSRKPGAVLLRGQLKWRMVEWAQVSSWQIRVLHTEVQL